MKHVRAIRTALAATALGTASIAGAQGMPVFDTSTYAQTLATVRNTLRMIDQGKQQLDEAQRLYGSMNKLTGINGRGAILSTSTVRNLLPPEARDIEQLISGNIGAGALGERAKRILGAAQLGTDLQGGAETDRAYQAALEASGQHEASTAAVAETAFGVTTRRTAGLEDLRLSLDEASDAKDVADLQARIAVEAAHIQNDQMQLQAITMRKAAQEQLDVRADDARMIRELRASFRKAR